mgnify:CR=1 FL=1
MNSQGKKRLGALRGRQKNTGNTAWMPKNAERKWKKNQQKEEMRGK